MGLSVNTITPRTFVQVGAGKFSVAKRDAQGNVIRDEAGKAQHNYYDKLSGYLKSMGLRRATVQGQDIEFLDITINDNEGDYVISVDVTNRTAEDIVMALASAETFAGKLVDLNVWGKQLIGTDGKAKTFTNISVKLAGEKLGWVIAPENRPAIKDVMFNGKPMKDRTDRINFVKEYIGKVQGVLAADAASPAPAAEAETYGAPAYLSETEDDDLPM